VREEAETMIVKGDPLSDIQSIFLEKDEIGNMLLDGVSSRHIAALRGRGRYRGRSGHDLASRLR
jgi:hypothetical protein